MQHNAPLPRGLHPPASKFSMASDGLEPHRVCRFNKQSRQEQWEGIFLVNSVAMATKFNYFINPTAHPHSPRNHDNRHPPSGPPHALDKIQNPPKFLKTNHHVNAERRFLRVSNRS